VAAAELAQLLGSAQRSVTTELAQLLGSERQPVAAGMAPVRLAPKAAPEPADSPERARNSVAESLARLVELRQQWQQVARAARTASAAEA
jgi:hypothetical protein